MRIDKDRTRVPLFHHCRQPRAVPNRDLEAALFVRDRPVVPAVRVRSVVVQPRQSIATLTRTDRWWLGGVFGFLIWGWSAWTIFAVSSRM